jgi:hypothetical protein
LSTLKIQDMHSTLRAARANPAHAHLLLAVHGLVLLQRCALALCVAAQLQHLALAHQPPLPELLLLSLHAALHCCTR